MKDLNFFKPYEGKRKAKSNFKVYVYGAIAIAAIVIIGTCAFDTYKIYTLNKSIEDYNNKLAASEIQDKLKEAESVNKEMKTLKEYDSALMNVGTAVKDRDNVSETLLTDICSTIPSEISFQSLNVTDNIITIKGTSKDRSEIAELKHNLSSLSRMQDVYVNSINSSASEDEYTFDVKCVLKDVG